MPNFDVMLQQTNVRSVYSQYILSSQYTHGTLWATWAFRGRNWGERSGSDKPDESRWQASLSLCGTTVVDSGCALLRQLGVSRQIFRKNFARQFERAISRVGTEN